MRTTAAVFAAATLAAAPAAALAATSAYQGYTSQGQQITFKRSAKGVFSMKIAVRANCVNGSGQNQGDYDFTLRATDTVADPVKTSSFTVVLPGNGKSPNATIKGTFNRRGTARGTIKASGRVTSGGPDPGSCTSGTVRWTAGA